MGLRAGGRAGGRARVVGNGRFRCVPLVDGALAVYLWWMARARSETRVVGVGPAAGTTWWRSGGRQGLVGGTAGSRMGAVRE